VLYASSHHAAGFWRRAEAPPGGLPADVAARPDTFYGWSKASGEAIGRLYADRFGMHVICLRIGSWCPRPPDRRGLAQWLSPGDGARLVEACLAAPTPGFRIVWGISRNTRRWCSLDEGAAIGYEPLDDAEAYAADFPDDSPPSSSEEYLGGAWPHQSLGLAPVPR
jgi:nucleoside-diphosphate-sugar epimerase